MKRYKHINNQKGASAVEFAIVLPLLFTIIFGIIEFGIIFYNKAVITNASREGARFGILAEVAVYPTPDGDIATQVHSYLNDGGLLINLGGAPADTSNISVQVEDNAISPASRETGDFLTVTVSHAYNFLVVPNFITLLPQALTLSGKTTMRME